MKLVDHLVDSIRNAAKHDPDFKSAPACILWPDGDNQWKDALPIIKDLMPELLVLGDYSPEERTGPAIWIRCILANCIEEASFPKNKIPIIYMPGVSRQDLRVTSTTPSEHLFPLIDLQYRGVFWSQINGKDCTVLSFLTSDQKGLGLNIAQDAKTKNAMTLALTEILNEDSDGLMEKTLDSDFFYHKLLGADLNRKVLQWLNQPNEFKDGLQDKQWLAFEQLCKSCLNFDPTKDGEITGATNLASRVGVWNDIWERFSEAPHQYTNIPHLLRKCTPPTFEFFANENTLGCWPQWNEREEQGLNDEFKSLEKLSSQKARKKIKELDEQHKGRRSLVWAKIGEAPLACILGHLVVIAENTKVALTSGTIQDLEEKYSSYSWKADDSLIKLLACLENSTHQQLIVPIIHKIYVGWADEAARYLQKLWLSSPRETKLQYEFSEVQEDDCILFVDGLRFDCAKQLIDTLKENQYQIQEKICWAVLPSVTGTGKPAVAPINLQSKRFSEDPEAYNFEPINTYNLRKAIEENGYQLLSSNFASEKNQILIKKTWIECGDIDHIGHDQGWKLVKNIENILKEIYSCINDLFMAGWNRVHVVTDHGWLLLPGGLPKVDLPKALTASKWSRCAVLKAGASSEDKLYSWAWNPDHFIAIADGIQCYKEGQGYAHGGLSLQECLKLHFTVTRGTLAPCKETISIEEIVWKGFRCEVKFNGKHSKLILDIRLEAGNPSSSVVFKTKPIDENGVASVVVENEDFECHKAMIILIDEKGSLVAQYPTVIGGGNNE